MNLRYNESKEWVQSYLIPNKENLLEFARKASDPFQFLSKALLVIDITDESQRSGNIYSSQLRFKLNQIPLSQDASASAYQLMSYLLSNEEIGRKTNMIPISKDEIQDIYSSLKDELITYLIHTKCSKDYPQCEQRRLHPY